MFQKEMGNTGNKFKYYLLSGNTCDTINLIIRGSSLRRDPLAAFVITVACPPGAVRIDRPFGQLRKQDFYCTCYLCAIRVFFCCESVIDRCSEKSACRLFRADIEEPDAMSRTKSYEYHQHLHGRWQTQRKNCLVAPIGKESIYGKIVDETQRRTLQPAGK